MVVGVFASIPHTAQAFTIGKPGVNNLGLVGHWTFDGKDVTNGRINDVSGNGNHGNASGIATSTFYRPGKIGQAGNFDGVDDRVRVGDMDSADGTATLTVSAWVKPSTIDDSAHRSIISKTGGVSGSFTGWSLLRVNTEAYRFYIRNSTDGTVTATSDAVFRDTNWHHVVGVYDGSAVRVYVDGTEADSTPPSATSIIPAESKEVCIGDTGTSGGTCTTLNPFPGLIDDVRIYSRALTAAEISALYNSGVSKIAESKNLPAGSSLNSGLVGHWTFDGRDITNGRINDVSGNGNHGNASGIATSTFYRPGKIGQAGNFDGVDDMVSINDGSSLDLTDQFTISLWGYQKSYIAGAGLVTKYHGSNELRSYMLYTANTNEINVLLSSDGATREEDGSSGDCGFRVNNEWTHITVTYINSGINYYRNGALCNTDETAIASLHNSTEPVLIGREEGSGSLVFFNGLLDDVRIYNRALSAGEVLQLYALGGDKIAKTQSSSSGTGINAGLLGHWTFDGKDVTNGRINDVSGNGNHGNTSGIATSTFYRPGKIGQAGNFDGVDDYVEKDSAMGITAFPYTMSAWANATAAGAIVFLGDPHSFGRFTTIKVSGGFYGLDARYDSGLNDTLSSVAIDGNWHHVVGVFESETSRKLYVDGVLAGTDTSSQAFPDIDRFNIGRLGRSSSISYFSGAIDDVRIYSRALSASEILQLYNMGR